MGILRLQLTPFFQRNQLCLGGGVVLCCQQLSSSQRWDSSSECSRKSRPHFPPGAAAQRDPLERDRAFLRKRGVRGGGVGKPVSPTPPVPNLSRLRSRLRADWELNGESVDTSLVI